MCKGPSFGCMYEAGSRFTVVWLAHLRWCSACLCSHTMRAKQHFRGFLKSNVGFAYGLVSAYRFRSRWHGGGERERAVAILAQVVRLPLQRCMVAAVRCGGGSPHCWRWTQIGVGGGLRPDAVAVCPDKLV